MWRELFTELLHSHRGKFFGALTGLLFGILVMVIGLLQTIFIAACIYVGYIIGKRVDDNESLREMIEHFFKEK
ncbi:MAG: DUF2273 domain-containing protein [Peptococcaceae bacterium]|jgi:uncharacterized membrane protein|nr:DUF2273 domain-containing protein [Peptococcaceae bacterium]MDH7525345.1 DUF2273 domain-containing protein [Peptococcaceae bacterium]